MMIHGRVVTPEGVYKEFDTPIINIDTEDGQRGILPNHMPLVTMMTVGKMETEENGKRETYAIAGGLFYFRDNVAEILTDAIENVSEIDFDRAEQARDRALKRIEANADNLDLRRAQIALEKALNRLSFKQ